MQKKGTHQDKTSGWLRENEITVQWLTINMFYLKTLKNRINSDMFHTTICSIWTGLIPEVLNLSLWFVCVYLNKVTLKSKKATGSSAQKDPVNTSYFTLLKIKLLKIFHSNKRTMFGSLQTHYSVKGSSNNLFFFTFLWSNDPLFHYKEYDEKWFFSFIHKSVWWYH